MSDLSARRPSLKSHRNTSCGSSTLYAPMISSPLAYPACLSSPPSCVSSTDMFQLMPSSPPSQSMLPFDDMDESEMEMPSSECDMIKMADDDQNQRGPCSSHRGGLFNLSGCSSPAHTTQPAWGAANQHRGSNSNLSAHQRAHAWKQPSTSRPSPRSSTFGDTPTSSPTPLSRAYISKANQSNRSPSELRQQAARRLRATERKNRTNAHRPLLDAFAIGTQRGVDDVASNKEELMAEAIGRRHIRQMNREWEELLSSATDELIEEAEESNNMSLEDEFLDGALDMDPSQIYAEYELSDDVDGNKDISMASTASTVQPSDHPETLLAVLLLPSSLCPACSGAGLRRTHGVPPGIQCPDCRWTLDGSTLLSVDNHFHLHGDRAFHQPVVGFNPHFGNNFVCSNPQCDEMICV